MHSILFQKWSLCRLGLRWNDMNKRDRGFYTLLGTLGVLIGGIMFVQDLMANGEPKDFTALGMLGLGFFVLISIPSREDKE